MLAGYEIDSGSTLICGTGGRQWRVSAPIRMVNRMSVNDLAAFGEDSSAGDLPESSVGRFVVSLNALARCVDDAAHSAGGASSSWFTWVFAGHVYCARVGSERQSDPSVDLTAIQYALRSAIPDSNVAKRLCGEPDVWLRPACFTGCSNGAAVKLDPRQLYRWEGGAWIPHGVSPPPLVDPVTGVLRRVTARPSVEGMPSRFRHVHAELPYVASANSSHSCDVLAQAGCFVKVDEVSSEGVALTALSAAIASGLAHLCSSYVGQCEVVAASAEALHDSDRRFLRVDDWRPHDPALNHAAGNPFSEADDHCSQFWVEGSDADGSIMVPVALAFSNYLDSFPTQARTNLPNFVGVGVGDSLSEACGEARGHVAAHAAVWRWWHGGEPAARLSPPESLRDVFANGTVDLRLLRLRAPVPVVVAFVDGPVGPFTDSSAFGFSAGRTVLEAAERAAAEALVQLSAAIDLRQPNSLIRRASELGNGHVIGLPAWRRDDDYRTSARDLIDPMNHVVWGCDPVSRSYARSKMEGVPDCSAEFEQLCGAAAAGDTSEIVVDLTSDHIASTGKRVVRVIVPGLPRLNVAAFPFDSAVEVEPYPGW